MDKPRHEWIAEQMTELGMYTQSTEVRKMGEELAELRAQLAAAMLAQAMAVEECSNSAYNMIVGYAGGYKWQPEFSEVIQRLAGFVRGEIRSLAPADQLAKARELMRDAENYLKLRNGENWPAVFASHDEPEPLREDALDAALAAIERQKG